MNEERGTYDFIDRIIAREDRGLVPPGKQPTNAEAARRARLPAGLRARDRGWDGEVETRRRLALLEEMLRTQAGVHVRLPSHHAAPFRSTQFNLDVGPFDLDDGAAIVRIDLFDGTTLVAGQPPRASLNMGANASVTLETFGVPDGHRAVINYVSVALTQRAAEAVGTIPGHATGVTFTFYNRQVRIPGLDRRFPVWFYGVRESGGVLTDSAEAVRMTQSENLLWSPINLEHDAVINADVEIPGANLGLTTEVLCKVGGYVYPTRIDEPSIRGTIVD